MYQSNASGLLSNIHPSSSSWPSDLGPHVWSSDSQLGEVGSPAAWSSRPASPDICAVDTLGASGGLGTAAGNPRLCESVAELVPDFLVKPLILRSACFCFFEVVVLGPLCHQLWPFPAPAAQPSSPPPSRPLTWPWTKRQDGQALVPWCCVLGGAQRDGKSLCYHLSLRRVVQRSQEFNLTRTIT